MRSQLPKVLHRLAGKPLLAHVLDTARELEPESVNVVIGHGADQVRSTITHPVHWALQSEQLGTGHAVQQGLNGIAADDDVLIAYGDTPLTTASTFRALLACVGPRQIGLLTLTLDDATGYGRIVRNDAGEVIGIVEQKDATPEQLAIREMNSGVLAVRGEWLLSLLARISNDNAQGEYYLTDLFALAVQEGLAIRTVEPAQAWEVDGVNSRAQLAVLERRYQHDVAAQLMAEGASLADPQRIDVRGTLSVGTDVEIDVNTVFIGDCTLADGVRIGPHCVLENSHVGAGSVVHSHSVLEQATLGRDCSVGPFARLRPGSMLGDAVRVGNFVETKNAAIDTGAKVNHLSYVGDATVGARTNIGAGTITCNYDGAHKHRTVIGEDVFVGSNTALVAPVTLADGATIGAGSTIVHDVPEQTLTLSRTKQRDVDGWTRPKKEG